MAALVDATGLLGLVGQGLNDTIISRVLGEVVEPEQRGALAREDRRDPGKRVVEVPDGDADAAADLNAGANDLVQSQHE